MASLKEFLKEKGRVDQLDREVLLAFVLGKDRSFVIAHPEEELAPSQTKRLRGLLRRRQNHEPLAYLVGEKEFFGLPFFVNRHTLIPRPETELLVEQVLDHQMKSEKQRKRKDRKVAIVDVGTGSGCIIISLVKNLSPSFPSHRSSFSFFATDISSRALRVARRNAKRHGVEKEITFCRSDLLARLEKKLHGFDEIFLLANLPYLSLPLYRKTEPGVRRYEPKDALFSGRGGLAHYRRLMKSLQGLFPEKSVSFFFEISPEQAKLLSFLPHPFRILKDLSGRSRLVIGSIQSTKQKPR